MILYQFSTAAARLRYTYTDAGQRIRAQAAESKLREQAIEHRHTLSVHRAATAAACSALLCISMAGGYACAMYAAVLLGDEDLFAVEDAIAD